MVYISSLHLVCFFSASLVYAVLGECELKYERFQMMICHIKHTAI